MRCSRPTLRVLSHNPQPSRPSPASDVTMTKTLPDHQLRGQATFLQTNDLDASVLQSVSESGLSLSGILQPFASLSPAGRTRRTLSGAILKDFISFGFSFTNGGSLSSSHVFPLCTPRWHRGARPNRPDRHTPTTHRPALQLSPGAWHTAAIPSANESAISFHGSPL